jgi:hypothetical protein
VGDPTDELYAPPQSERATKDARKRAAGKTASGLVVLGLSVYAALQLVSVPFAVWADAQLDAFVRIKQLGAGVDQRELVGAEAAYHGVSMLYHSIRAVSEVGMVLGYVAGLVWLYQAWSSTNAGKSALKVGPWGVVLWSFVPVWGVLRLHMFLLRIARKCEVGAEGLHLGPWVGAMFLQLAAWVAAAGRIGGIAVVHAVVAVCAAFLGIRIVRRLQRGLDERAERKRAAVGARKDPKPRDLPTS